MDINELFTLTNKGLIFAIKVIPNAKKDRIGEIVLDSNNKTALKIYTTAVPEDGKANKAVIKLLSEAWHLRKDQINIMRGFNQRNKIIHRLMEKFRS